MRAPTRSDAPNADPSPGDDKHHETAPSRGHSVFRAGVLDFGAPIVLPQPGARSASERRADGGPRGRVLLGRRGGLRSARPASRTSSRATRAAASRRRTTTSSAPARRATRSRCEITYDPAKISYGQLLKVFFAVAHDPTQLNRQGPDEGPQYRSAIFFNGPEQKTVAEAYIKQLNDAKVFPAPYRHDGGDARRLLPRRARAPGFHPAQSVEPVRPRQRPSEARAPRERLPGTAQT